MRTTESKGVIRAEHMRKRKQASFFFNIPTQMETEGRGMLGHPPVCLDVQKGEMRILLISSWRCMRPLHRSL